jgi:phosphoglycolate phosphatase
VIEAVVEEQYQVPVDSLPSPSMKQPLLALTIALLLSSQSMFQTANAWTIPTPTPTARRSVLSTTAMAPLLQTSVTDSGPDAPVFCWSSQDGQGSRLAKLAALKSNLVHAKLIVFDKDGTLGDCSSSLKHWCRHMTQRLTAALVESGSGTVNEHVAHFHSIIGWDAAKDDVVPSAPVAAGTWEEQVGAISAMLERIGLPRHLAKEWDGELGNVHGDDDPVISNLKEMLLQCQELGLRVAVCTSDDRRPTDQALSRWDIANLVEYSLCGDEVTEPKPSAAPLMQICGATFVNPSECIVVGDTTADTGMARNAQSLMCIGVLTGSGTPEQLTETGADIILPHVGHIPALLQAMGRERRLQVVRDDAPNDGAALVVPRIPLGTMA